MSLWWELRPSPASPTCSTFFKLHTAGPLLTEGVLLSSVARLLVSRSVDGGPIVFFVFSTPFISISFKAITVTMWSLVLFWTSSDAR